MISGGRGRWSQGKWCFMNREEREMNETDRWVWYYVTPNGSYDWDDYRIVKMVFDVIIKQGEGK
jgi:hypothetical protein